MIRKLYQARKMPNIITKLHLVVALAYLITHVTHIQPKNFIQHQNLLWKSAYRQSGQRTRDPFDGISAHTVDHKKVRTGVAIICNKNIMMGRSNPSDR